MHTDSSASSTCLRFESAVECTATVLIPSSRQALRILRAISPRLAMTTLSSMKLFDDEQRLAEFDRFAVVDQDGFDATGLFGLNLVHHFHCFDHAQHLADLDLIADADKFLGARGRRREVRADHRRRHDLLASPGLDRGGWR